MATLQQAQNVVVAAQIADSLKQQLIDLEKTLAQNGAPDMQSVVNLFLAIRGKLDDLAAAQAQLVAAQNAVADLTSQLGAANIKLQNALNANADLTAQLAKGPAVPAGGTTTSNPAFSKTNAGQIVVSGPATAGIALGAAVVGVGLGVWVRGMYDEHTKKKAAAKEVGGAEERKRMKK